MIKIIYQLPELWGLFNNLIWYTNQIMWIAFSSYAINLYYCTTLLGTFFYFFIKNHAKPKTQSCFLRNVSLWGNTRKFKFILLSVLMGPLVLHNTLTSCFHDSVLNMNHRRHHYNKWSKQKLKMILFICLFL